MSNQWTHCKDCHYEKTHTETQHPCSVCHGGDECLDPRIPELQAQVAKMRKALEEIKTVQYILEPSTDESERADYWGLLARSRLAWIGQVKSYRNLAREALKDLPPT